MLSGAYVTPGGSDFELEVTNPATNLYAISEMTFTTPNLPGSDWYFDGCLGGLYLNGCAGSGTNVLTYYEASAHGDSPAGIAIPPGATDYFIFGVEVGGVPTAGTFPYTGTFTTTVQDGSSPSFYAGTSFTVTVLDPDTSISTALSPVNTAYIAGTSPYTVTATVSTDGDNVAEAGLPISFTAGGSGDTTYTQLTASGTTAGTGVDTAAATGTFGPSDIAGTTNWVEACITGSDFCDDSGTVTTIPGAPATVAFLLDNGAFPATHYIVGAGQFATPNVIPSLGTMAEIIDSASVGNLIGTSVADRFGNALPYSTVGLTVSTFTVEAISGGGGFDDAGSALLTTICSSGCTNSGFVQPNGGTEGNVLLNYFQSYTYATLGALTATLTGTYQASPFTVGGSSGDIFTSTQAGAISVDPQSGADTPVMAGGSATIVANLTASTQPGVPITVGICISGGVDCAGTVGYTSNAGVADAGYANSGFATAGGAQAAAGGSALGKTSTTSGAGFTYFVDTVAGDVAYFNASASAPSDANPAAFIGWTPSAHDVSTTPGAASTLVIQYWYTSLAPTPGVCTAGQCQVTSGDVVQGLVVYPDVSLSDMYGNPVTNVEPFQAQIELSASSGTLSATTVYIKSGGTDTFSSFGAIAYYVPSSGAVGTVLTLSASGVVNGFPVSGQSSLTIVSALPTFTITSPSIPTSGVIYSNTASAVFRGVAAVSAGYDPATTNIVTISYVINGAAPAFAVFTAANSVTYAIAAFLKAGLNTISFSVTDSNAPANTYNSPVYQVLVDTGAPTITFPTSTSIPFGSVLPVTIVSAEGDLNVTTNGSGVLTGITAWYGTTNLQVTGADLVGSNTVGTSSSFTLNLNGIPSGTWVIKVQAATLAGNSASKSESLTITIQFSDSVLYVANSASYGTEGAYNGVFASFTNGWGSSQNLVFSLELTGGATPYAFEVGVLTVPAGATANPFIAFTVPVPAGTYTLYLTVATSTNLPVSGAGTTITSFTVT